MKIYRCRDKRARAKGDAAKTSVTRRISVMWKNSNWKIRRETINKRNFDKGSGAWSQMDEAFVFCLFFFLPKTPAEKNGIK